MNKNTESNQLMQVHSVMIELSTYFSLMDDELRGEDSCRAFEFNFIAQQMRWIADVVESAHDREQRMKNGTKTHFRWGA